MVQDGCFKDFWALSDRFGLFLGQFGLFWPLLGSRGVPKPEFPARNARKPRNFPKFSKFFDFYGLYVLYFVFWDLPWDPPQAPNTYIQWEIVYNYNFTKFSKQWLYNSGKLCIITYLQNLAKYFVYQWEIVYNSKFTKLSKYRLYNVLDPALYILYIYISYIQASPEYINNGKQYAENLVLGAKPCFGPNGAKMAKKSTFHSFAFFYSFQRASWGSLDPHRLLRFEIQLPPRGPLG